MEKVEITVIEGNVRIVQWHRHCVAQHGNKLVNLCQVLIILCILKKRNKIEMSTDWRWLYAIFISLSIALLLLILLIYCLLSRNKPDNLEVCPTEDAAKLATNVPSHYTVQVTPLVIDKQNEEDDL